MGHLSKDFHPNDQSFVSAVAWDEGKIHDNYGADGTAAAEVYDHLRRMGLPVPYGEQFQHRDPSKRAQGFNRFFVNACGLGVTVARRRLAVKPPKIRLPFSKPEPELDKGHPFGLREIEQHEMIPPALYTKVLAGGELLLQINPGVETVNNLRPDVEADRRALKEFADGLKRAGIIVPNLQPENVGLLDGRPQLVTKGIAMLAPEFNEVAPVSLTGRALMIAHLGEEMRSAFATGASDPVLRVMHLFKENAALPSDHPEKAVDRHWENAKRRTMRLTEMNKSAKAYEIIYPRLAA